jgi:hypothetical protein
MQIIVTKNKRDHVNKARKLLTSVGNGFGSVWFIKRSDGSKRKLSYRIHVRKPQYVKVPSGENLKHKKINEKNNLITIFDCNMVRYNHKDRMCGRGGWKSIPLDGIIRIAANGEIYRIIS